MTNAAWRAEQPSEIGVYWNRRWGITQIVEIAEHRGRLVVNCMGDTELENYSGEWYGPLEVPQ